MPSPSKLRIHHWAKGKTLSLVSLTAAQQLAYLSEDVHDLLLRLRRGEIDERLPARPPVGEWLALYQDHRRVLLATADCMPDHLSDGKDVGALLDGSRALST